jgi:DNA-binding LacI/PurR family transcriptional regulator
LYGFAAALEGIEEATREVGFGMGFRAVETLDRAEMCEAVERAIEPAGALIVIAFDRAGALALECVPPEVPTVAMIQAPTGDTVPIRPSVWIDEFSAAKEATEYLLRLGHQTVHHLPIPSWSGATRRMEGWSAALEEADIRTPEAPRGGWTSEWGYDQGCRLAKDSSVTAVLCGNDDIALGVMRAMHEAGRSVPGDVSIVGFDDIPYARFFSPALTTVRQDFKTLGRVCFARLLDLSSSSSPFPELASPQAQLIIRESVGPPPTAQRRQVEAPPTRDDSAGARPAPDVQISTTRKEHGP